LDRKACGHANLQASGRLIAPVYEDLQRLERARLSGARRAAP
jgi:hypothetical protein